MTKNRLYLFFWLMICACNNHDTQNPISKLDISANTSVKISDQSRTDPDSAVIHFLKWYRNNEKRLQEIQPIAGGLSDSTSNYYIDFPVAEKYIRELRSSGFLSDFFLSDLMELFKRGSIYLKKHPQNDGPVQGFDADLIMKSQDYQDIWDSLGKVRTVEKVIVQNKALIHFRFNRFSTKKYYLSKSGNQWLIDSIGSSFATDPYYSFR